MKTKQNTRNWKTNTCECQGTLPFCLCIPLSQNKCMYYYGAEGGYCFSSNNVVNGKCGDHR